MARRTEKKQTKRQRTKVGAVREPPLLSRQFDFDGGAVALRRAQNKDRVARGRTNQRCQGRICSAGVPTREINIPVPKFR